MNNVVICSSNSPGAFFGGNVTDETNLSVFKDFFNSTSNHSQHTSFQSEGNFTCDFGQMGAGHSLGPSVRGPWPLRGLGPSRFKSGGDTGEAHAGSKMKSHAVGVRLEHAAAPKCLEISFGTAKLFSSLDTKPDFTSFPREEKVPSSHLKVVWAVETIKQPTMLIQNIQ